MFGNMAGQGAAGGGTTGAMPPIISSGAAGGSMVPTPPPPMANPVQQQPQISPLSIIMKALSDPQTMARKMADAGVTPDAFKQAISGHNLGATMEATKGPAANADTAFGSDVPGLPDTQAYKSDKAPPMDASQFWLGKAADANFKGSDFYKAMAPDTGGYDMPGEGNGPGIMDMLMSFFKGGGTENKGATSQYLGNNPQMNKGPMPPISGPAGLDGIPSLRVGGPLPIVPQAATGITQPSPTPPSSPDTLQPSTPYNGLPNHQIPPMVGEQYNARAAQLETRGMPADMREYISNAATQAGIDPNYMLRQAIIESGGNPKAFNESSKAAGLYQFVPGTAKQYGLDDPFDWKASTNAAVKLAVDNRNYLRNALGREPSNAELYLAHQQGAKGAADMLMNRDRPATSFVGSKAISSNGGDPSMSAGQYVDMWERRYNEPSIGGSSGGNAGGGNSGDVISGGSGNNSLNAANSAGSDSGNTTTPKSMNSRLADIAAALQQGGDDWSKMDLNLPKAPAPVAPRTPQQYQPDANMLKLFLGMLYGGGGPQIPSISQLMGG